MKNRLRHITVLLLIFSFQTICIGQEEERIVKYRADINEFAKNIGNGAQRLLNNVEFIHGGAKMYCDSAYYYSKSNTFDAFEDIFINQGDTVHVYGDFLHYNGNTEIAVITGNVRLINNETTLTTDVLEYDLGNSIGYYTQHGHIVNNDNTLESTIGYYYAQSKTFRFRDSVLVVNPDYKIYSDTLNYNTESGIAYFFGPTDIISDSNHIYCEDGWYDTKEDLSELKKNAWADNGKQRVNGQYIFYNRNTGDGFANTDVRIYDYDNDIILLGEKGEYNEITEYAFMTDSAQFLQYSDGDTLFLHGDSLITYPDTSGEKILHAYYHVKFFRADVQGKCDSLCYTFSDSVARMFGDPILWTADNQASANTIEIFTKNQEMERMELHRSAFMVSQKQNKYFDQIKGKNMTIFFVENELNKLDVKGNGQTVYYLEDGPDIVGVNRIDCTNITIYFADGKPDNMKFFQNNKAVLYPLNMAPENEVLLKGLNWRDTERPKSKEDIFNKKGFN